MKKIFFIPAIMLLVSYATVKAQSLAINTDGTTANASALLDVKSTTKGILIPRMLKSEKNAIAAPATGLLVFQTAPDSIGFHYYDGTAWIWILGSSALNAQAWKLTGNSGTNPATNFIDDHRLGDQVLLLWRATGGHAR